MARAHHSLVYVRVSYCASRYLNSPAQVIHSHSHTFTHTYTHTHTHTQSWEVVPAHPATPCAPPTALSSSSGDPSSSPQLSVPVSSSHTRCCSAPSAAQQQAACDDDNGCDSNGTERMSPCCVAGVPAHRTGCAASAAESDQCQQQVCIVHDARR